MNPDILKGYENLVPKNRKERRNVLKRQGWYYRIEYLPNNDWRVFKVFRGCETLVDTSDNHKTY